ncbi:MAG: acylneuraminate cytidylyltransferase family protein [Planctomycetes bacterium]|nr:acylneuraminate cytidylyltransferase family protein [Planctomycetota bacterium]
MAERTEILALIPARGGSKGIPGKNIRLLGGRPLIDYAWAAASGCPSVTRIIVDTDSDAIAAVARQRGAEVPYLRPADLAQDATPTIDVVIHALRWLADHQDYRPEIVLLLQPTAPLRTSAHLAEALRRLQNEPGADAIVSVSAVPAHYNPLWQYRLDDGTLRLFCGGAPGDVVRRRQDLPPTYIRNGAIYATRTETVLRGSLYGERCLAYEMPAELHLNIDTWEDWQRAEALLEQKEMWRAAS